MCFPIQLLGYPHDYGNPIPFPVHSKDCSRPLLLRDGSSACHFRAAYRGDGRAVPEEAPEQPTSPLKMAVFRGLADGYSGA